MPSAWSSLATKQFTTPCKHVGVMLTLDATWESYVNTTTSKASRTWLGLLRWTLKIGVRLVKEQVCMAFVRPVFKYASPVWDLTTSNSPRA